MAICVCLVLLVVTVPVFPTFFVRFAHICACPICFFLSFGLLAYLSACFYLPLPPFCCAYLYKFPFVLLSYFSVNMLARAVLSLLCLPDLSAFYFSSAIRSMLPLQPVLPQLLILLLLLLRLLCCCS